MINQVVIAAAGYGSRIPHDLNPKRSKPLMEYNGQPILGYVIDGLREGGIDDFIVASGYHSHKDIEKIARQKDISARVIPVPTDGALRIFQYIPDLLNERFMLAFGHQPLPSEFVSRMLKISRDREILATVYDARVYPTEKGAKVVVDPNSLESYLTATDARSDDQYPLYMVAPYIFPKDVLSIFAEDNFVSGPSKYTHKYWLNGGNVAIIEASMPPEFDYAHEFKRLKLFLDALKNRPSNLAINEIS